LILLPFPPSSAPLFLLPVSALAHIQQPTNDLRYQSAGYSCQNDLNKIPDSDNK
jgi:hypothetical protein